MEEKVIIRGVKIDDSKLCSILLILGAILNIIFYELDGGEVTFIWVLIGFVVGLIFFILDLLNKRNMLFRIVIVICVILFFNIGDYFEFEIFTLCSYFTLLPSALIAVIIRFMLRETSIIVTNKRVYGISIFSNRIDLPLDMISAVRIGMFKSIGVSTASGTVRFIGIKNNTIVHEEISKLLSNRQENKNTNSNSYLSTADEIKQYKMLLDEGYITEKEYEKKKEELLNK